jgi:hypothetical protein
VEESKPLPSVTMLLLATVASVAWRQGLTLVHFSAQPQHLLWAAALYTSALQSVKTTVCGLDCVFESQKRLRLSWEVDASCGFNDQNWRGLR